MRTFHSQKMSTVGSLRTNGNGTRREHAHHKARSSCSGAHRRFCPRSTGTAARRTGGRRARWRWVRASGAGRLSAAPWGPGTAAPEASPGGGSGDQEHWSPRCKRIANSTVIWSNRSLLTNVHVDDSLMSERSTERTALIRPKRRLQMMRGRNRFCAPLLCYVAVPVIGGIYVVVTHNDPVSTTSWCGEPGPTSLCGKSGPASWCAGLDLDFAQASLCRFRTPVFILFQNHATVSQSQPDGSTLIFLPVGSQVKLTVGSEGAGLELDAARRGQRSVNSVRHDQREAAREPTLRICDDTAKNTRDNPTSGSSTGKQTAMLQEHPLEDKERALTACGRQQRTHCKVTAMFAVECEEPADYSPVL